MRRRKGWRKSLDLFSRRRRRNMSPLLRSPRSPPEQAGRECRHKSRKHNLARSLDEALSGILCIHRTTGACPSASSRSPDGRTTGRLWSRACSSWVGPNPIVGRPSPSDPLSSPGLRVSAVGGGLRGRRALLASAGAPDVVRRQTGPVCPRKQVVKFAVHEAFVGLNQNGASVDPFLRLSRSPDAAD